MFFNTSGISQMLSFFLFIPLVGTNQSGRISGLSVFSSFAGYQKVHFRLQPLKLVFCWLILLCWTHVIPRISPYLRIILFYIFWSGFTLTKWSTVLFCRLFFFSSLGFALAKESAKPPMFCANWSFLSFFFHRDSPKELYFYIFVVARPTVLPTQVFSGFVLVAKQHFPF